MATSQDNPMKEVIECLVTARNLIAHPKALIKYVSATTPTGRGCCPYGEHAAHWCATGAVSKAATMVLAENSDWLYHRCVEMLNSESPTGTIQGYNDLSDTKHADIMRIFDRTIETARAKANDS